MHSPQRPGPSLGLTPDADSLRQWQATRFHFAALRQPGHLAPAGHATARDGDLARVDARHRYDQTTQTRQMVAEKARQARMWQALHQPAKPQYTLSQTPNEDYYKPEAVRQRAITHRLAQQRAQLLADHPLEAQVGEGVVIGSNIVTGIAVSEVAMLRLASGLRWTGLAVRGVSLADAGEQLIIQRAALQEYQSLSLRAGLKLAGQRSLVDFTGQSVANYYSSNQVGFRRVLDAGLSSNLVESTLAGANMRPFAIGAGSSLVQYSIKGGLHSPLDGSLSWRSFGAQAVAGTVGGYVGLGANKLLSESFLSRRLAYSLYQHAALRMGHDVGYPLWLSSAYLMRAGLPVGVGAATTQVQNIANTHWPTATPAAAPAAPPAKP